MNAVEQASRLPPETRVGRVRLRVRDLGRALAFYRDLLGLRLVDAAGGTACLSATGRPPALLVLEEDPGAVPKPPRSTGLYHFAILFPDRRALARAFLRLARRDWPFQGFSDHLVSEAIYLPDPDGNGVELYADRPRAAWPWRDGRLVMDTRPLDLQGLVAQAGGGPDPAGEGVPPETSIGHVHLHVSSLEAAEAFYAGAIGFDVTVRGYPGALFFAAGGYHHHLGVNVWAGVGAPRPPERAVGLLDFSLRLPPGDAAALAGRLRQRGLSVAPDGDGSGAWWVADPDGIVVRVEPSAS